MRKTSEISWVQPTIEKTWCSALGLQVVFKDSLAFDLINKTPLKKDSLAFSLAIKISWISAGLQIFLWHRLAYTDSFALNWSKKPLDLQHVGPLFGLKRLWESLTVSKKDPRPLQLVYKCSYIFCSSVKIHWPLVGLRRYIGLEPLKQNS